VHSRKAYSSRSHFAVGANRIFFCSSTRASTRCIQWRRVARPHRSFRSVSFCSSHFPLVRYIRYRRIFIRDTRWIVDNFCVTHINVPVSLRYGRTHARTARGIACPIKNFPWRASHFYGYLAPVHTNRYARQTYVLDTYKIITRKRDINLT